MRISIFSWLFLIPLFQILTGIGVGLVRSQCLNDQRSLLLQLKQELDFNRTLAVKLKSWNQNTDCCVWGGVACDSSGHVISLELDGEYISGGIQNSSSLFGLQHLARLNMANNTFGSVQIPDGLFKLTNLMYLNFSNAGFGGQLPLGFSEMRKLLTLDLSTRFPGRQPLKLENPNLKKFLENLTSLEELYLDGVNISAQGADWCQAISSALPNLRVLSLSNCRLSGSIDPSLSELRSVSVIRLDNNNLSTAVPEFFGDFNNLTTLSLSSCNLQGQFPERIFQVTTLQNLDISINKILEGSLPPLPGNSSFRNLVLSYTTFSGSLPDSIGMMTMLSRIDLSNCNFSGAIPSSMENLTELVYLDFSSNNFSGSIPSFQKSKNLGYIDMSRNALTGSLSSTHFEGLSKITLINLGYNSLTGSIPPSLFALPSLQKLQLPNNQFSGQITEFLKVTASQLDTLDLSGNRLQGPVPSSLFNLGRLNVLSLSSNFFNGTLQLEIIRKLQNLTRLELSFNNLSIDVTEGSSLTPFPQISILKLASCKLKKFPGLRNQSRMLHLDLSDNSIQGSIPNWIWEENLQHLNLSFNQLVDFQLPFTMVSLSVIDLHSNQLQGEIPIPSASAVYVDYSSNKFNKSIPVDIGNVISFASFFSLSNNRLTGTIPKSICNFSDIQVLDLSNNALSGRIPDCILEKSESIGVLNLGRNNLSGIIPNSFPTSCSLKTLDLSRNDLEGQLPVSLSNCESLEVLNVGNNNIEDTFPCILKNLSSLRVLVLRSNMFHGGLHCGAANNTWPNLQIIDIASNNFSGELSARCFLSWRGMMIDDKEQSGPDHLRFDFLNLNHFYYQDAVTVTIKGLEMELVKILTVFTSIDFSCNNFTGPIPETVGELRSLYILNLSRNALTGHIPGSIGNLSKLGSLDLSVNHLSGEVPAALTSLTFLSFLNLSFNNLVGKIPRGRQFETFTNMSYLGNEGLCGLPLTKTCKDATPPSSSPFSRKLSPETEFNWQFIFTGVGFGVGAAIILAPLAFCQQSRKWCDDYLEELLKRIFPLYGFTYTRYHDSKVVAVEITEEDYDESDESDFEDEEFLMEDEASQGRYCVFCTKLDAHRKKAIHNTKCTCHTSTPIFSYSSSPSSSLLVVYRENF